MPIDVAPGEWNCVDFSQNADAVIRSGFKGDAFTVCAGIIVYLPESHVVAVMHSPPSHKVGVDFYNDWFNQQYISQHAQIVIIPPKVKGSEPGRAFGRVIAKAEEVGATLAIVERSVNVKVSVSAKGCLVYDSLRSELLWSCKWVVLRQKTGIPIAVGSSLNDHYETATPIILK